MMKIGQNIVVYLVLLLSITTCQLNNDVSKVNSALQKVIKINHCGFSLEIDKSSNQNTISIESQCHYSGYFFYGKCLIEFKQELDKERMDFNHYSIKDDKGKTILYLSKNEIERVQKLMRFFEQAVQLMNERKYDYFLSKCEKRIVQNLDFEGTASMFNENLKKEFNKFQGFFIEQVERGRVVEFEVSDGEHSLIIVYSLDSVKDEIIDFQIR
jgi:hypothetical protein